MYYQPKTDEQLEAERPKLIAGEADFEVVSAALKEGEHGQYMLLNIKVYDKEGKIGFLNDFLPSSEKGQWKLKQFCDAAGLENEYMNPPLQAYMLSGKCGKCMIFYAPPKEGQTSDQLKIKGYINTKKEVKADTVKPQSRPQTASSDKFEDDDIPF